MVAPALRHIDAWIFDLDNSLYPALADLCRADRPAGESSYKLARLRPSRRGASRRLLLDHGTTLAVLMKEHVWGREPRTFLDFVHDIDLPAFPPTPGSSRRSIACPAVNSCSPTATRPMRDACSTGWASPTPSTASTISMRWTMCPSPTRAPMRRCASATPSTRIALCSPRIWRGIWCRRSGRGMTTVWVDNGSEQASHEDDLAFIDYRVSDIGDGSPISQGKRHARRSASHRRRRLGSARESRQRRGGAEGRHRDGDRASRCRRGRVAEKAAGGGRSTSGEEGRPTFLPVTPMEA